MNEASGTPISPEQAAEDAVRAANAAPAQPGAVAATSAVQGAAAPAASGGAAPTAVGGDEAMIGAAARLVDANAPWKRGMPWAVVLTQGIVLAVAGAVIWLAPGFGAAAVLQVLGILLLITAALSVWRLVRDQVMPRRVPTVAFRAGVGMTTGLLVVIGSLIVDGRDTSTVAMAIVLGIGLVLYGLSALVSVLVRREPGSKLSIVGLVLAALTVIVGILLVVRGRDGIESLQGTFALLGIVLLLAGLALGGYAFMLRERNAADPLD